MREVRTISRKGFRAQASEVRRIPPDSAAGIERILRGHTLSSHEAKTVCRQLRREMIWSDLHGDMEGREAASRRDVTFKNGPKVGNAAPLISNGEVRIRLYAGNPEEPLVLARKGSENPSGAGNQQGSPLLKRA